MTRQRLSLIGLALGGLAVQALWALRLSQPAYMDAAYYATNGSRLANGFGFTEQIIWQYLNHPTSLPTPSHTYWMPLASLLSALGETLWPSFRGMQLPFVVLAGLLPLLSFAIVKQLGGNLRQAVVAGLFTMAGGFYAAVWGQPETFAPFAWLGGGSLLLMARAQRWPTWLAAGLLSGLAFLTRSDGSLLLLTGLLLLAWQGWRTKQWPSAVTGGLAFLLGALAVMAPWLPHMLRHPSPALQTMWLTTYDDLFSLGRDHTLATFLAWGCPNFVRSRLMGLSVAGQSFVAISGLIFLTPLVVWGWINRWRAQRSAVLPLTLFSVMLFGTMALIFTFPGSRGGLFHASVAIFPWTMALAALGLDLAIDWVAARLSHWEPATAKPRFGLLAILGAFALSLVIGLRRPTAPVQYGVVASQLPTSAVVMVGDAPSFHYQTGLAALSLPNEPLDTVLLGADPFNVTHLLLDPNRPQPLADLYALQTGTGVRLISAEAGLQLYEVVDAAP